MDPKLGARAGRAPNEIIMKPYFENSLGQIYCGNAPDILRQLPDELVQCVVTSPPYWGLRDYGLKPIIWDDHNGCEHEWHDGPKCHDDGQHKGTKYGARGIRKKTRERTMAGRFCIHCNAWRGSLGHEPTIKLYISHLVQIFQEIRRILKKDGTVWLNLGDSYATHNAKGPHGGQFGKPIKKGFDDIFRKDIKAGARHEGLKEKDICMIPARLALALQADGWWLRSDIIWAKPNPMPESVTDRPTKAHEYIFLLTKNQKYYYDSEAIREDSIDDKSYTEKKPRNPGKIHNYDPKNYGMSIGKDNKLTITGKSYPKRNKRSVWTISTYPYPKAHFATFPEALVEPCILAGSRKGDIILDPFYGSGTVGVVAAKAGRKFIGIDLKPEYCDMAIKRIKENTRQRILV